MTVWSKDGQAIQKLRLNQPNALPLHQGDTVRIFAEVKPAAYLYLFWIGTEGKVEPLYPWKPGHWGTRPAAEEKRDDLELPVLFGKGLTLVTNAEGMETLVLLARAEPLTAGDDEVKAGSRGWASSDRCRTSLRRCGSRTAAWSRATAAVSPHFEITDVNDPVLRVQELLRGRWESKRPLRRP